MIKLDGYETALKLNEQLKMDIEKYKEKKTPTLAIILVGHNPASESYVKGKEKASNRVGIHVEMIRLHMDCTEEDVFNTILSLNANTDVHAMILQLPLPKHFNKDRLIDAISMDKDADGFHTHHQGLLHQSRETMIPATPLGIMILLDAYHIEIKGKRAVVLGRSNIVGAPIARLLMDAGATVTICHSKTLDITSHTKEADIIIVAIGIKEFLKGHMVKEGVVVVDVGINREGDILYGDVLFEEVSQKASYLTPVPKGVGPMTIHGLLKNTFKLYLKQEIK